MPVKSVTSQNKTRVIGTVTYRSTESSASIVANMTKRVKSAFEELTKKVSTDFPDWEMDEVAGWSAIESGLKEFTDGVPSRVDGSDSDWKWTYRVGLEEKSGEPSLTFGPTELAKLEK